MSKFRIKWYSKFGLGHFPNIVLIRVYHAMSLAIQYDKNRKKCNVGKPYCFPQRLKTRFIFWNFFKWSCPKGAHGARWGSHLSSNSLLHYFPIFNPLWVTHRARKFKKVQAKKLIITFSWNCISDSFKLFPSLKSDVWLFLKLQ